MNARRIFLYLVAYRWASLAPAFWLLFSTKSTPRSDVSATIALSIAVGVNLLITIFHRSLNRALKKRPYLLGLDIIFVSVLLSVGGAAHGPYYLYALSPLLAAAFFFQMRGAFFAAAGFTPLYALAITIENQVYTLPMRFEVFFTQLAGIWIIALLFGYPAILLKQLQETHDALSKASIELEQRNRALRVAHEQLKIVHELTVSLQNAADIQTIQQQVLMAITNELGLSAAVMGLVNPMNQRLGNWEAHPLEQAPPATIPSLRLTPDDGLLMQWLMEQKVRWWQNEERLSADPALNAWLGPGPWLMLPMIAHEHPVGLLLVAAEQGPESLNDHQWAVLESVVDETAGALSATMICIDRARRLAVEQERNRIARDIHDTVVQLLFGIVFSLDASIRMLPDKAENVKSELIELRELANQARSQVRHSIFDIWPHEITLERFEFNLRKYAELCGGKRVFHLQFHARGDFDHLPPSIRRNLYRIAQEAIANVVKHAGVDSARVCLYVDSNEACLSIQDQGRGFDAEAVLKQSRKESCLGLAGIQQRIRNLGGECAVLSRPNLGAQVLVWAPIDGEERHA